jgi:hypothetical protein
MIIESNDNNQKDVCMMKSKFGSETMNNIASNLRDSLKYERNLISLIIYFEKCLDCNIFIIAFNNMIHTERRRVRPSGEWIAFTQRRLQAGAVGVLPC